MRRSSLPDEGDGFLLRTTLAQSQPRESHARRGDDERRTNREALRALPPRVDAPRVLLLGAGGQLGPSTASALLEQPSFDVQVRPPALPIQPTSH